MTTLMALINFYQLIWFNILIHLIFLAEKRSEKKIIPPSNDLWLEVVCSNLWSAAQQDGQSVYDWHSDRQQSDESFRNDRL